MREELQKQAEGQTRVRQHFPHNQSQQKPYMHFQDPPPPPPPPPTFYHFPESHTAQTRPEDDRIFHKSYTSDSKVHPFVDMIMAVPVPQNFKQPTNLEQYDGVTDPQEHLEAFHASMLLSGAPDAIMCRAFSTTLKKAALRWFMSLPARSIACFSELADRFLAHFATSRVHRKTSASLIGIKQGKNEPLKSYLSRFNRAALEINDLKDGVAVHSILVGLQHGDFSKSLAKRPAETLTELLARSAKFINAEEVEINKRQAEKGQDDQFRPERNSQNDRRGRHGPPHRPDAGGFRRRSPPR